VSAAAEPQEIELKLSIAPDQVDRLRRHPAIQKLKQGRASTKRQRSVYFDTPGLDLRAAEMTLRVRSVGGRFLQTVKAEAPGDAVLKTYIEHEAPVGGESPDLSRIADADIRAAIEAVGAVRPVFATDVKRTAWLLKKGRTTVELALDIGAVESPGRTPEPICEAELELVSGRTRDLMDIALMLTERVDLIVSRRTKAARGYDLFLRTEPQFSKAPQVTLSSKMTAWDAFTTIAGACLDHVQANEDIARKGEDPEGVHQTRLALRRLRAVLYAFRGILPKDERRRFNTELRWAQRELGMARDVDVLFDETLSPLAAERPRHGGLGALLSGAEAQRGNVYRRVRETLNDRRYTKLLLSFSRWLMERPDMRAASGKALPLAADIIDAGHDSMLRYGEDILALYPDELHALRIVVKKQRYPAEALWSLFPDAAMKNYTDALIDLQNTLGGLNDVDTARRILEHIAVESGRSLRDGRDIVEDYFEKSVQRCRTHLPEVWRRVEHSERFWRKR
jgi:triphosphatase